MMEPKVLIQCRRKDVGLLERVLGDATAAYKAKLNLNVDAIIDHQNPLPESGYAFLEL
jgi:hypothetical protein